MSNNRRQFIKKSASLATLTSIGRISSVMPEKNKIRAYASDAGMQLSEAYFHGPEQRRMDYCRQMNITGAVTGVKTQGDVKPWEVKAIIANKAMWDKEGLKWNVVEGPPSLGDKTKLGLDGRDEEISNFITFMKNLKQHAGVDIICYNWMPVIGWFRTNNAKPARGGALVTSFDFEDVKNAPLTKYGEVSRENLWANLEYFLKAVIPEAEKIGMKLAMHPDDPQVDSLKGIGRIMTTVENFKKLLKLYPSASNGITMCQGNFSLMGADIPAIVKDFGKEKIHFVHFRNVRGGKYKFEETFHDEGQIDMYAAMKSYYDIGFTGPIRPDHVPTMAGDVNEFPGYSNVGILYALGYIRGLMEAIGKA
ncbi:MAG TPA: mannonate dehydratase [Flavitalea sp.]|nr:mannonate dehydratase [Flavitalea sp.]